MTLFRTCITSWLTLAAGLTLAHSESHSHQGTSFLPENNLHLEIQSEQGLDEETFHQVLDYAEAKYKPIIKSFGATLRVNRYWSNGTVNASANQSGNVWHLNMYGGLARRSEVTADGFALVVCHELGHHLGGVVFYAGRLAWAASEGQSDYFATVSCARELWGSQPVINATYEAILLDFSGGEAVKEQCDKSFERVRDQHICYRSAVAGKSLGGLLAALGRQAVPQFDTPDNTKVRVTSRRHPKGQCRLDTYVAGAFCNVAWDKNLIPGKNAEDRNGLRAFMKAEPYACHSGLRETGHRPHCWFAPKDVKRPVIHALLGTTVDSIGQDEESTLLSTSVNPGDEIIASMSGSGDADMYVKFGKAPTQEDYDCAARKSDSIETCQVRAPSDAAEVFVRAFGNSSSSRIHIKLSSKKVGKFCRDAGGGFGKPFACFEGLRCKLMDESSPKNQLKWCIDYF